MWHRSEERKLRGFFRSVQQEPVPDTLRKRLQADVDARFAEPGRRARFSGLVSRVLRLKPLLAGTAAVLVAVIIGVLLTIPRKPDVLAAVLEAMEQIETAHSVGTDVEAWYSREHGTRAELKRTIGYSDADGWFSKPDRVIYVSTPEAIWEYYPDTNTAVISSDPERIAHERDLMMKGLSGTRMLNALREKRSADSYQISDVVLDGVRAKRIDYRATHFPASQTTWIDAETMRVIQTEMWRTGEDGRPILVERARTEYDVPVDPALFSFTPPPGVTVIDYRRDPALLAVVEQAIENLGSLPVHEIGENGPLAEHQARGPDRWPEWEAWRQGGVGYRIEYADGEIRVGNRGAAWCYWPSDRKYHHDQYNDETTRLHEYRWGVSMLTKPGGWCIDRNEVTYEREGSRRLVHVPVQARYGPNDSRREGFKRTYTFDLETKRLTQHQVYLRSRGEWGLERRVRFDYPPKLPEGIFGFNPPPGARIEEGLQERWEDRDAALPGREGEGAAFHH